MNRALLALAACGVLAGCGGSDRAAAPTTTRTAPPVVAASCIFVVEFDGHRYVGTATKSAPPRGESLGDGTIPACNDTPGAVDDPPDDQSVEVFAVEGVRPEIALALGGRDDVVLVREDVDRARLPAALENLTR